MDKHYSQLTVSVLGKDVFSETELRQLQALGVNTSNTQSLLSLVYYNSFINKPTDKDSPTTITEMEEQQSVTGIKPEGQAPTYTVQNVNDKTRQYIEKLKLDMRTKIEGIIRENNDSYKMDALRNLKRPDIVDEMIKESTLGKVRQKLRDTAGDANRDWTRVAITEMSNAIGIANVDRIVSDNLDADIHEIYVFRITVKDAKTCKYCRRFYNDADGSPKLYRLSTLLANGSNYGKKADEWKPVAVATHPNERCAGTVELKPGFKLLANGSVTYMGLEGWHDYVKEKLAA